MLSARILNLTRNIPCLLEGPPYRRSSACRSMFVIQMRGSVSICTEGALGTKASLGTTVGLALGPSSSWYIRKDPKSTKSLPCFDLRSMTASRTGASITQMEPRPGDCFCRYPQNVCMNSAAADQFIATCSPLDRHTRNRVQSTYVESPCDD